MRQESAPQAIELPVERPAPPAPSFERSERRAERSASRPERVEARVGPEAAARSAVAEPEAPAAGVGADGLTARYRALGERNQQRVDRERAKEAREKAERERREREARDRDGRDRYHGRSDRDGRWHRDWRRDRRHDWRRHRRDHRDYYQLDPYQDYAGSGYRRLVVGMQLDRRYLAARYRIVDPYRYRLPMPPPGYAWVRYYDDVLLIDLASGRIVDLERGFFR